MAKRKILQMEPHFDKAEAQAVYKYMQSGGWVMEFKETEKLEKLIAKFTKTRYCSMMPNGTISLTIAMLALGLKPGDEILVPNLTMIASPNSAILVGIKPVLVDIEQETLCMSLENAKKKISKKTKALMYVPFNGRSGDMGKVKNFCKEHKLFLIEDAAQALGSYWKGKHLGTFGDIGSFSFSVPKIITTGQGGALVTNKKSLHEKIQHLKNFGRKGSGGDIHNHMGWNFRFTDIQAVIGIEQMKKLKSRIKRKKEIYERFKKGLKDLKKIEFIHTSLIDTSPWFVDIYVANPNKLAQYLANNGIGTRRIYPAIHTQKVYKKEYSTSDFPNTRKYAKRGLWLPSSSILNNTEIDKIVKLIDNFYCN